MRAFAEFPYYTLDLPIQALKRPNSENPSRYSQGNVVKPLKLRVFTSSWLKHQPRAKPGNLRHLQCVISAAAPFLEEIGALRCLGLPQPTKGFLRLFPIKPQGISLESPVFGRFWQKMIETAQPLIPGITPVIQGLYSCLIRQTPRFWQFLEENYKRVVLREFFAEQQQELRSSLMVLLHKLILRLTHDNLPGIPPV